MARWDMLNRERLRRETFRCPAWPRFLSCAESKLGHHADVAFCDLAPALRSFALASRVFRASLSGRIP